MSGAPDAVPATGSAARRTGAQAGAGLARRTITALVGIPVVALAAWAGEWWLLGLVGALALVGGWEGLDLASRAGAEPARPIALAAVALLLLAASLGRTNLYPAIVAGLVVASLAAQLLPAYRRTALLNAASMILVALYVGVLFAFLLMTRRVPGVGREALLLTFAVIWVNDTAAYFVGVRWGRRRLLPAVSPGKTWEGSIAGLVGGVAAGLAVAWGLGLAPLPAAALAVASSLGGQVGDLAESALKRSVGAKDAGAILPGHGGILDRFDSLLFAAPIAYYLAPLLR